jgi:hypothetical protein
MPSVRTDRYARQVVLADIGEAGQAAIMAASVRIAPLPWTPAEVLAAQYLVAAGVGQLDSHGVSEQAVAAVAARGPDTQLAPSTDDRIETIELAPEPSWWPSSEGDVTALWFWRAGITATQWLARAATSAR